MDKTVLIVTERDNDFLSVLQNSNIKLDVIEPNEISETDLENYYSIALLGGVSEEPLNLHPKDRLPIDEFIDRGGRVFCEYVTSISELYFAPPESTKKERLVFCLDSDGNLGLEEGSILDPSRAVL